MKKSNWIKTYLVDILPCVTILLYILAIVYEMALFSVFDISVLGYISLTENLVSIIEPLLYFTLIFLIVIADLFILSNSSFPSLPTIKKITDFFDNKKHLHVIVKILIIIPLFPLLIIYGILYGIVIMPEIFIESISKAKVRNYGFLFFGTYTLLFFILSYCAWLPTVSSYNGMGKALYGLMMPLIIAFFFSTMRFVFPGREKLIQAIKKITLRERVFFLVIYYIFAIAVFSYSGFDYGNTLKQKDSTVFTIRMTDGTVFDNTKYGYISKMGNHVFLYEKASDASIILYNENIGYQKIINDDSRKPMLYDLIKKSKQHPQNTLNNTNTTSIKQKQDGR